MMSKPICIPIVFFGSFLLSGCDFYVDEINEDWSLCAADDANDMMLCRNLGEGSYHGVLEPVMVAWGYNGRYISLKQCSGGEEAFYSVEAVPALRYDEPDYTGPFSREDLDQAIASEPERWPDIEHTDKYLQRRHCLASE